LSCCCGLTKWRIANHSVLLIEWEPTAADSRLLAALRFQLHSEVSGSNNHALILKMILDCWVDESLSIGIILLSPWQYGIVSPEYISMFTAC